MYNFSGFIYRIRGQCVPFFLMGIILLLLERPWKKGVKIKECIFPACLIAMAIGLCITYVWRIKSPDISTYTGWFVSEYPAPRAAIPTTRTHSYLFRKGADNKKGFYLDISSEKKIFPEELEQGKMYTVYYDELTKIIVRIDIVE